MASELFDERNEKVEFAWNLRLLISLFFGQETKKIENGLYGVCP
jgi:hypothetical protein